MTFDPVCASRTTYKLRGVGWGVKVAKSSSVPGYLRCCRPSPSRRPASLACTLPVARSRPRLALTSGRSRSPASRSHTRHSRSPLAPRLVYVSLEMINEHMSFISISFYKNQTVFTDTRGRKCRNALVFSFLQMR